MSQPQQPGMPQTPDEWRRHWQESGQHQNPYARRSGGGYLAQASNGMPYASWLARVAAALIDGVLLVVLAGPVLVLGVVTSDPGELGALYIVGVGWYLLLWAWLQWRNGSVGRTPGKRVMGITVVGADTGDLIGGPMGLLRGFVAQAISLVTCGCGGWVDVLWPLWDVRNQTLHDKAVGTVVIRTPR